MDAEPNECLNVPFCNSFPPTFPDLPLHVAHRPEVQVDIFGKAHSALLDSGASVSAISEEFFSEIKTRAPTKKSLSILPVTGVTISTAVRGRSRKITRQVFIPLRVFERDAPGIFLVVPHLATPIILGDDWLTRHGVVLDYLSHQIHFPRWEKSYSFQIDTGNVPATQITKLDLRTSTELVFKSEIEYCLSSLKSCHKFSTPDNIRPIDIQLNCIDNERPLNPTPNKPLEDRIDSSEHVPKCQKEKIVRLLEDFQDVFSDQPGRNKLYVCRFDVSEDIPFKVKPYPIPFSRRPAVQTELNRMLDWGVIERCSSPYANPIVCVGKPDGSVRLCLDARRINRLIVPMRDSSPPLDELLARFSGKTVFSSIDFTAGYWQVMLHHDVRKYTAFIFEGRTYQFCVVPFGLNISNTAFGKALEAVLQLPVGDHDDQMNDLHIYVDDLMISSISFEDHIQRLNILLQKIRRSGMTLKLSKCEFLRQRIKFLGHIITPTGMQMDPAKLQAIREFPVPRNRKEIQSFVGFVNFYRKFSANYASTIGPLIDLIKKNTPWKFGYEELKLFNRIKESFTEKFLCHPNFDHVFYLQTDASKIGLGAELFQLSTEGERQTISFASRTLNAAERNYSITELELLSIVFACEKFRVFILGYPIHVLTDHQALTFLFHCRLRNARLTRWTLLLQEFNLQVEYIPGSENIIDALSRNPAGRDHEKSIESPCILMTTPDKVVTEYRRNLKSFRSVLTSQMQDDKLAKIVQNLSECSTNESPLFEHYTLVEGVLFYRRHHSSDQWLVCVPSHRIEELILQVHRHFGHVGPKKTTRAIRDFCFFKGFQRRIRSTVQTCNICQRAKPSTVRIEGELKSVLSEVPLGRILVDLYGPLPPGWNQVRYIFVVLDNFSRFVRLYPIKKATAVTVTNRMINDYIGTYGTPRCIVSDHGVQFTSKVWQTRLSDLGIPPTMTTVYHPQSNPAERIMRELGRLFRTYCYENHTDWPHYVRYVEWVLNNTVHEATGHTPQELFLKVERYNPFSAVVSFPLRVPLEEKSKLTMAREIQLSHAERRKRRHDQKGPPTSFVIGTQVLVRTHRLSSTIDRTINKFFLLYEGPFKIIKRTAENAYTVVDPVTEKIRGTFNVVHLRRYLAPKGILQQAEAIAVPKSPRTL